MKMNFYVALICICCVSANVYNGNFRINWSHGSPDGYSRAILSINNEYPCPTIIVTEGDLINITVRNELNESTSIHWHGLNQHENVHMDGVPGVTQCPIRPNQTFVYQVSTENQSGTYWYHSHSSIQYGDGLKGILIIQHRNDPWKQFYDDEQIIELTDWYHIPLNILIKPYLDPGEFESVPVTGLINGIGQFNCTLDETCSFYRATIRNGTTKRFRIINTSVYAQITFSIDQHEMRLIEVDGTYLDGNQWTRTLLLNPGQRYSILVTTKTNSSRSYWIRSTLHPFIYPHHQYNTSIQPNASAILQYVDQDNQTETILPSIESFFNDQFRINQSIEDARQFADQMNLIAMNRSEYQVPTGDSITTLTFNSQFEDYQPHGVYFNNQTFVQPINRTLLSLLLYDNSSQLSWPMVIQIENKKIYDVIINNIDYAPHPFHLHGHHVWIVGQGRSNDGYLNETTIHNVTLNTTNAIYRDTFTVNPYSYLVFRFLTTNPGIWIIHCHNDWHLQVRMAFVFNESPQLIKQFYFNHNLTNYVPFQCQI